MDGMNSIDAAHWQERLDTIAGEAGVVGASLGILRVGDGGDELVRAATGVLNARTGRGVTPDSLFQIGSITKPMTGTVAMQLVDEGKIGLDQPVRELLPDFRLVSDEQTNGVTVRHLLNHSSGIDGDVFVDTGRGDDCLTKFMTVLETVPQMHPLGELWSYCNTGFSMLGRIIEVVTGETWDVAMRARLFEPLGMRHTVTLPEDALLFDTAVGHMTPPPDATVTPVWMLPRSGGPAGVVICSVADLLAFARGHMMDGAAADGTRVLSAASSRAMRDHSVDIPATSLTGDTWGLSFERFDWHGATLFGHDGATLGQTAYLRVLPQAGLAVALLTNSTSSYGLFRPLFVEIFDELAGVKMPDELRLPPAPYAMDMAPWVGTYERGDTRLDVIDGADGPSMRITQIGDLADLEGLPVEDVRLIPVREGLCAIHQESRGRNLPVWFIQLSDGARVVHYSSRATRRVV